jgi:two-component system response regulator FixJ
MSNCWTLLQRTLRARPGFGETGLYRTWMSDTSATVMLVEDDEGLRFGLRSLLTSRGYRVKEATCCAEAMAVAGAALDVVLLDYELPDGDALELMPRLRAAGTTAPVVILTGNGTIPRAVQAVKQGAHEFLTKPVEMPRLLQLVAELATHKNAASAARDGGGGAGAKGAKSLWELERDALVDALVREGGRVGRAAKRLSIPRSTFYLKIKAHEIDVDEIRVGATERMLASSVRTRR